MQANIITCTRYVGDKILCRYCNKNCIKHGSFSGKQRYRCCTCKRTFVTSYIYSACKHNINTWIENLVKEGCGIRSIARLLKITLSTSGEGQGVRYKFNAGTELEDNFDVDYYETYFRNYDAQIGRFTGIDIKAEATWSLTTYQFAGNNPVIFNDPLGDKYSYIDNNGNAWHHQDPLLGTAAQGLQWQDGFGIDGFGGATFGGGGGGAGGGNYGQFWGGILNQIGNLPKEGIFPVFGTKPGENHPTYCNYYQYTSPDLSGVFITSDYHGFVSHTEGEWYHFTGEVNFSPFIGNIQQEGGINFSGVIHSLNNFIQSTIPDNVSFGITFQDGIFGGNGASVTYSLNLITHGKDAGLHKSTTVLPNTSGLGFAFSLPEIGYNYYNGQGDPTFESILGTSGTVSGGFDLGAAYNYSIAPDGSKSWNGYSVGFGLDYGVIYGQGTTYPGW